MQLFDAHCHLQDERLGTLQDVVQEAASKGVQQLACNGCWAGDDWARVAAAAAEHPAAIVPNFGLHPWWLAQRSPGWLQQLREMLVAYPRAGLGEVRKTCVCQMGMPNSQMSKHQDLVLTASSCFSPISVGWIVAPEALPSNGRCSWRLLSSSCSWHKSC